MIEIKARARMLDFARSLAPDYPLWGELENSIYQTGWRHPFRAG
ncbi:hypothetical protein [Sphingomonas sp.]|nr:hypothetical protein [Sphingomonas sp.]